jgi:hypothetical protein
MLSVTGFRCQCHKTFFRCNFRSGASITKTLRNCNGQKMDKLRNKLACLSKPLTVTDNNKDTGLLSNISIFHTLLICCLYYKSFAIIIYYCNDSGMHYKTMMTARASLR